MDAYEMNPYDTALQKALMEWRDEVMIREGNGGDTFFGSQLVLSDNMLDRIVDLAHYSKLTTLQVFAEQTNWRKAYKYGEEVLALVRMHAPPPPPHPLQSPAEANEAVSPIAATAKSSSFHDGVCFGSNSDKQNIN